MEKCSYTGIEIYRSYHEVKTKVSKQTKLELTNILTEATVSILEHLLEHQKNFSLFYELRYLTAFDIVYVYMQYININSLEPPSFLQNLTGNGWNLKQNVSELLELWEYTFFSEQLPSLLIFKDLKSVPYCPVCTPDVLTWLYF